VKQNQKREKKEKRKREKKEEGIIRKVGFLASEKKEAGRKGEEKSLVAGGKKHAHNGARVSFTK